MNNQSNSEIIKATREFRDVMTADTAIIEIAKMLSTSADRLDVTTAALREKTRQCDALAEANQQLAAENAGLKEIIEQHANSIAVCPNCSHEEPCETDDIVSSYRNMETPTTAAAIAEVQAQGVEMFAAFCSTANSGHEIHPDIEEIMLFAAELRKGAAV
ncbi:hypothetical protein MUA02_04470 [Enterobacteriaceae bacterium H20N1]|uniref:Uncharacterized protein n=1 Tax=Dryocola boscaweniae TaxID=2925397 RepID=A0A9X2W5Y1_9ENTR|nr:hypothetical protein [Dryocola boscaweniae]MCT4701191.1 hypothetical protein [Dryocola boscaweniae]MCT4718304.1 hypothetical protein [Dryocola boscaweniae]